MPNDYYNFEKEDLFLNFPFRIAFAGPMASGKSTLAVKLLDNLG